MKLKRPPIKQPTPVELRDEILRFIERHFYPNQRVAFCKDTPKLLKWVVLKLAVYLTEREVAISLSRYAEIMTRGNGKVAGILMDALRFGDTGKITYIPAYLGQVVDSHLAIHGEDYYNEGKSIRAVAENALSFARGGLQQREADPMRELRPRERAIACKTEAR